MVLFLPKYINLLDIIKIIQKKVRHFRILGINRYGGNEPTQNDHIKVEL